MHKIKSILKGLGLTSKTLVLCLCLFLGWIIAASSTIIWAAHAIKHIFFMNAPFFTTALEDLACWALQLIVGLLLIFIFYWKSR